LLHTIPVTPQEEAPVIEDCDIPPVIITLKLLSRLCPPVKSELNNIGFTLAGPLAAALDLDPPDLDDELFDSDLDSDLDSELLDEDSDLESDDEEELSPLELLLLDSELDP
jgi:hypothetical protein